MDDPLGNRDLIYGVPPELTVEERRALDAVDMTPILGTLEERLRFAIDKAVQFMRERNDCRRLLRELILASECFLSSEIVDETSGTIPLMDRLRKSIEAAKAGGSDD